MCQRIGVGRKPNDLEKNTKNLLALAPSTLLRLLACKLKMLCEAVRGDVHAPTTFSDHATMQPLTCSCIFRSYVLFPFCCKPCLTFFQSYDYSSQTIWVSLFYSSLILSHLLFHMFLSFLVPLKKEADGKITLKPIYLKHIKRLPLKL